MNDPVVEGCLKALCGWEVAAVYPLADHLQEIGHPLADVVTAAATRLQRDTAALLDRRQKPRRGWAVAEEVGVRICSARLAVAKAFDRQWKGAWVPGRRRGGRLRKGVWAKGWTWKVIREAWSKNHLSPRKRKVGAS